ncbi:alkaline phosphatase family protein [Burkholderia territorii]|uniref:alkaline phosphatase family protein n=1 Tax=Burkholderia territorii TaxID=1503055 RepID=UPI00075DE7E6|nr:alkaline phosphatase family protein [Burkholderia territorii]KWA22261.1 phosphoesterase [Burkholderia territorii]KWA22759.1 phosphoesterase [Burkholderia territorii]
MSADATPAAPAVPAVASVQDRIRHVFVLMLENRSFDHLFALSGIAGITAASSGDSNAYDGTVHPFGGGAPDRMPTDPCHEFTDVLEQLCGAGVLFVKGRPYPGIDNSGFVSNYATSHSEGTPPPAGSVGAVMQGADVRTQAPSLYALANAFVLCDRWHASMPGPTWPNRFFLHGASSAGLDHSPTREEMAGWDTLDGFHYPNGSIFAALGDDNWRIYQDQSGDPLGHVPQVASLKGVSFFDVDDLSHFEADLAAGYTARYTFIEPGYGDIVHGTYRNGSSQHPMDGLAGGDQLVARVYDAIRNSPVWASSLLVIVYDEHGGFYDSVRPGAAPPPNDGAAATLNASGFGFDVYGVRVPAIVVSPWVAAGHVDHTPYDHSSVVATLGRLFGLAPLTDRDRAANDLLSLVTTTCRTDCPTRIGS